MSAIRRAAEDYLRMRRELGYKLEIQGWMLDGIVSYLEQAGARTVTIEHAVAWATQPAHADPTYWSDRLSVARQFARHLQTIDPACEVPPTRLLRSEGPHMRFLGIDLDLLTPAEHRDLANALLRAPGSRTRRASSSGGVTCTATPDNLVGEIRTRCAPVYPAAGAGIGTPSR